MKFKTLILIMMLVLSGCTALKYANSKKPKVALESLHVKNVDAKGANLLFNLKVDNPNNFPLKIDSLKYAVEIGGRKLAGEDVKEISPVGANSQGYVSLPLRLSFADIFNSLGDFLKKEMTDYHLTGSVKIGGVELHFNEVGKFKWTEAKILHQNK